MLVFVVALLSIVILVLGHSLAFILDVCIWQTRNRRRSRPTKYTGEKNVFVQKAGSALP